MQVADVTAGFSAREFSRNVRCRYNRLGSLRNNFCAMQRACTDGGHAWTRNALEIDRMQPAMCRRSAHALMMVTPEFAMHRKLTASNF